MRLAIPGSERACIIPVGITGNLDRSGANQNVRMIFTIKCISSERELLILALIMIRSTDLSYLEILSLFSLSFWKFSLNYRLKCKYCLSLVS